MSGRLACHPVYRDIKDTAGVVLNNAGIVDYVVSNGLR